jgi:hypothetical protein
VVSRLADSEREEQLSAFTDGKAVQGVSRDLLRKCSACFGRTCGEALARSAVF